MSCVHVFEVEWVYRICFIVFAEKFRGDRDK